MARTRSHTSLSGRGELPLAHGGEGAPPYLGSSVKLRRWNISSLLRPDSGFICDVRRGELRESLTETNCGTRITRPPNTNCLQTMESLPTVLLKPGEADRIVAGHPWIYHAEILRAHRARRRRRPGPGQGPSPAVPRRRLFQFQIQNQRPRPVAGAHRGERNVFRGTHPRRAGRPAEAPAGRHLVPRRQRRERFSQRPHRGQIRGRAGGADFVARHGPAQGADRGRAAKDLLAARHPGTQRHGVAQV